MIDDAPRFEDEDGLVGLDEESIASEDSSTGESSLAKNETKFVSRFRILLLFLLVGTALSVSLTAYFVNAEGEREDFVNAVASHATKIIETFEEEAVEKRTALIQLSRELTSHAKFANMTWPFVHLPDWELRAMLTRELADVIGLFVLPIVTRENLDKWATYTVANQGWFAEGMAIQEMYFGVNATRSGVPEFDEHLEDGLQVDGDVFQFTEEDFGVHPIPPGEPGPFFPSWQFSPQIPVPVINADFGSMPESRAELDCYLTSDSHGRYNLVGPAWDFEQGSGGAAIVNLLLERYGAGGRGGGGGQGGGGERNPNLPQRGRPQKEKSRYVGGPLSYYYIPIHEGFEMDAPLVGVIMSFVFWQTYFEKLLPRTAVGIEVVLENTCGQAYTFGISGPKATFLGDGDLHNTKYDFCGHETDYGIFLQRSPDPNKPGCLYKLRIYPTQEMEDKYITGKPLFLCLCILGVFLFTTLTFILYDRFVERRQQLVMTSAQESGNVIRKLFPEEVRDRLYQNENKGHNQPTENKINFLQSKVSGMKRSSLEDPDLTSLSDPMQGASPIADLYPHCTVYFADLAGFTKWSSARTPSEVFLLLETIYGAFDKIAKKLSVFKIETIGDCYVAVTGLPKPQPDHAVVMCKFAASCILKFNQIVNSENILLSLGDDTTNLQMRVGMHSGAVTAGVLRGAKARFQLFGDTVNTAARMESNGQKGKIQVSQATADLLVAAAKDKWLTAREDLVEAKGKGQMQTYWVNLSSDQSIETSVTSTSRPHGSGDDSLPHIAFDHQPGVQDPQQAVYIQQMEV